MTHPNLEAQLDAYLDGELAAADARALEAHIGQCSECTRWRDDQVTLRAAIKSQIPVLRAPDILRQRVRAPVKECRDPRQREHVLVRPR